MSEPVELLNTIRPLKTLLNPLFFNIFHLGEDRISQSKIAIGLDFCSVLALFGLKVFILFRHKSDSVEDYVNSYGFFLPYAFYVLGYFGFLANARSIRNAVSYIVGKSSLVVDKSFLRRVSAFVHLEVIFCVCLPFSGDVIYSVIFWTNHIDLFILIDRMVIDLVISLRLAATAIVFSNCLLLCHRFIATANNHFKRADSFDWDNPMISKDIWLIGSKIRRKDSRSPLTDRGLSFIILTYDKVCQWSVDFNVFFGGPLAACFISNLIQMLHCSYYIAKYKLSGTWMLLFFNIYYFLQNLIILYSCEKLISEVQETQSIVNRIIMNSRSSPRKELLQQFAIALDHRKIKFTAWGLFKLNKKAIYSMVTTLSTYLAIVFQFEVATNS